MVVVDSRMLTAWLLLSSSPLSSAGATRKPMTAPPRCAPQSTKGVKENMSVTTTEATTMLSWQLRWRWHSGGILFLTRCNATGELRKC